MQIGVISALQAIPADCQVAEEPQLSSMPAAPLPADRPLDPSYLLAKHYPDITSYTLYMPHAKEWMSWG